MIQILLSVVLFFLAALHIYWGHSGLWPGENKQDLINKVYGRGSEFPSISACYFVAIGLLCGIVILLFQIHPEINRVAKIFFASVFVLRGVLGYSPVLNRNFHPIFRRYNISFYSPICILIGAGFICSV